MSRLGRWVTFRLWVLWDGACHPPADVVWGLVLSLTAARFATGHSSTTSALFGAALTIGSLVRLWTAKWTPDESTRQRLRMRRRFPLKVDA